MRRLTLGDLLAEEDELGLLDVKPLGHPTMSEGTRVVQQFEEINVFVDRHHFVPGEGPEGHKASITERQLQMRLKAYTDSPELAEQVRPYDRHGVLAVETLLAPKSLDEILDLDDELLTEPAEDIFTFRHARPAA